MANYLPSEDQITLLNGELWFKPDGSTRYRSLGYVDTFSWTPNIEKAQKRNGNSGLLKTVKEKITSISATVAIKLAETNPRNMMAAFQGTASLITQTAQTGATGTETDVDPGELISTGLYDITNLVVTDGTDELVLGTDYTFDAATGDIAVMGASRWAQIVWTCDCPDIVEADERNMYAVLSAQEGVKGVIKVIGKNQEGSRYLFDHSRVALTPNGETFLINEDGDFQSIELNGEAIENPATPLTPYGTLVPLPAAA